MSFKMNCPNCNRVLKVTEKVFGKSVPCPACKQTIVVPRNPDGCSTQHRENSTSAAVAAQRKGSSEKTTPPPRSSAAGHLHPRKRRLWHRRKPLMIEARMLTSSISSTPHRRQRRQVESQTGARTVPQSLECNRRTGDSTMSSPAGPLPTSGPGTAEVIHCPNCGSTQFFGKQKISGEDGH